MTKMRAALSAAAAMSLAGMISVAVAHSAMASGGPIMHIVESPVATIGTASGGFPGRAAVAAECPAGEFLTGGGAKVTAGNSYAQRYNLAVSQPMLDGKRWWAFATNTDPNDPGTLQAYAICATKTSVVDTP